MNMPLRSPPSACARCARGPYGPPPATGTKRPPPRDERVPPNPAAALAHPRPNVYTSWHPNEGRNGASTETSSVSRVRYTEIASYLRGLVADAAPGARLPSDAQLCERFGVSRMTARHAVQQLVTQGLVYRRRGQGTFVAERPVPRLLGSPLSFTESMRRRGLE